MKKIPLSFKSVRRREIKKITTTIFVIFLSLTAGSATSMAYVLVVTNAIAPAEQTPWEGISGKELAQYGRFAPPEPRATPRHTEDTPTKPGANVSVMATASVTPSRLIIVNDNSEIVEILSTARAYVSSYVLSVRLGRRNGEVIPLSDRIGRQYEQLLETVDWSQRGRVFSVER